MTYEIKIRQSVATCLQRYKSRTIGCEAHALVSEVSVFVSADGHVRGPTHAQKVRPTAGNGPTDLAALLGVSDVETIRRLNDAVLRAVRSRSTSSVRWRTSDDIIGKIISVRPAHEKGLAVIAVTDLDAPSGTISIALLMDIFELTRAEAEIAASLFCKSDLADIARERGVQLETVRGQVKAILHKVGTASQKQLMLVLSRVTQISSPAENHPPIEAMQFRAAKTG
jgi:DNA-binding CsgD family transcriptional regulator